MIEMMKRFLQLLIIFMVTVYALTMVYIKLQPEILNYRDIKEMSAALDIFQIPYPKEEVKIFDLITIGEKPVTADVKKIFNENIITKKRWGRKIYENYKGDNLEGYAFVETRKGYGFNKSAPISILIGLKPDLETLIGIKPLDYGETPGLGGRIGEKWFQDQFRGKKLKPSINWTSSLEESKKDPNKFLAITGATSTTKGISLFLNNLIADLWKEMDKTKK